MPFLRLSYDKKAPAFANIDNIEEKIQKHYGTLFTNQEDFNKVLEYEKTQFQCPGALFGYIKGSDL